MEQLSLAAIGQELRRELGRRRELAGKAPLADAAKPQVVLPRLSGRAGFDSRRGEYRLQDFLDFHDRDFVVNAYLGIMKRAPDGEGLNHFLLALRGGHLSKVEIIGRLRYSEEGKEKKVKVRGLLPVLGVCLLGKLPLLGYPCRWLVSLLRLPVVVGNMARHEAYASAMAAELREHVTQLGLQLETILTRQSELLAKLEREKAANGELLLLRAELKNISELSSLTNRNLLAQGAKLAAKAGKEELQAGLAALREGQEAGQARLTALAAEMTTEGEGYRRQWEELSARQQGLAEMLANKAGGEELRAAVSLWSARQGADRELLTSLGAEVKNEGVENRRQWMELLARQQGLDERLANKAEGEELRAAVSLLSARQGADRELLTSLDAEVKSEGLGSRRQWAELSARQERQAELLANKAEGEELQAGLALLSERQGADRDQLATLAAELGAVRQDLAGQEKPVALPAGVDAMYVAFEERFRGSREEICRRQRVYLPLLAKVRAAVADGDYVDLGCGRGEWLELLRGEGYPVRGVDQNRLMVAQCRELGLAAEEAEALAWLQALPAGSLAAITGFHLVEHLAFAHLLALLAEARRVLKPGGLLLFETPNPENILVGACYFHYDLTHRRPLVPDSLSFIFNFQGFIKNEIIRLHPHLANYSPTTVNSFQQQWVDGAMDYAVCGYQP